MENAQPLPVLEVQHAVDDHACYGDVQPDGERPARNPSMAVELSLECAIQRHRCQNRNGSCQSRVSDENRKINCADRSRSRKMLGSGVVMIREIRHQKKDRGTKCNKHAKSMICNQTVTDQDIPGDQKDRTDRVQDGIDSGKVRDLDHARSISMRVKRSGR